MPGLGTEKSDTVSAFRDHTVGILFLYLVSLQVSWIPTPHHTDPCSSSLWPQKLVAYRALTLSSTFFLWAACTPIPHPGESPRFHPVLFTVPTSGHPTSVLACFCLPPWLSPFSLWCFCTGGSPPPRRPVPWACCRIPHSLSVLLLVSA